MSLGLSDKENLPPILKEDMVHGKETPDLPHDRDTDPLSVSDLDSLSAANDSRHSKVPSIQDFVLLKPISRGAFGKVFLGYKRSKPSKKYAIKIMKKADMIHKNMVNQVIAERNALALSKSPFIVRLFYSLQSRENIYLVMEYMIGGDVKSLLSIYGFFEEEMAVLFTAEVIAALEYLHSHSIVHRDLKPDNMLIASDGHIKLTDFGLSQVKLNRQINITDVMETPGIKRVAQTTDYHRTPGQILSLTSNLAFGPTSRKILQPSSSSKIFPGNSPFMSPRPKFQGSMTTKTMAAVQFTTPPQIHGPPPPIRSLTPTLKESQSIMTSMSDQSSISFATRATSRASACSKVDSLVMDDSVFPPNSTMSTPRSSIHGNTSSLKSFAAENMKSLREGMISAEMPPPSCGSRNLSSTSHDEAEKESDSSFGSIELRRRCESSGSPDLSSKKICFSAEDLEANIGLGSRKRSFHYVEKSPLGDDGFISPSKHTGLTGEFYGVSLGDEHRLKRCNISEIESNCDESSAPSQHLDFSKLDASIGASDSGEMNSPPANPGRLPLSPNTCSNTVDRLKSLIGTPPAAALARQACKDSLLSPSFLRVPLGRDKSISNHSASSAEAHSLQRTSQSSGSASLSSDLHNMSLDDHAMISPNRLLSHSGDGSTDSGHEVKKVLSCPNLLEHDRIRSIRFAEKQFIAMLSESENDCSSLNDADVSNLSGVSGASVSFRNKLFKKHLMVARQDMNLDQSLDTHPEVKPRMSRKSEGSAVDECDNVLRVPRFVRTARMSLSCPKVSRSLSLPNTVTDTEADTSDICNTPISRNQATCFLTPARGVSHTPFRTPKSVRRGAPLKPQSDRILGTPDYLAPELLLQKEHGESVDWWALGVCLYEFLTGVPPFNDTTPEAVFQNILNRDMIWPEGEEALSTHASNAIEQLLDMDASTRPKAAELKQHLLFQKIDWNDLHAITPLFVPTPDDDTDTSYFDARNNLQDLKVSAVDLSV